MGERPALAGERSVQDAPTLYIGGRSHFEMVHSYRPTGAKASSAAFQARAAALGAKLAGLWIQHMFAGERELIVTALRDAEFGVIVGVGLGGGMTEVIDDVVLARAPIEFAGALDLLKRLKTLKRIPAYLSETQRGLAADFVARFSTLAASAPWPRFTLEVNPLKLSENAAAAVDALLLVEQPAAENNLHDEPPATPHTTTSNQQGNENA